MTYMPAAIRALAVPTVSLIAAALFVSPATAADPEPEVAAPSPDAPSEELVLDGAVELTLIEKSVLVHLADLARLGDLPAVVEAVKELEGAADGVGGTTAAGGEPRPFGSDGSTPGSPGGMPGDHGEDGRTGDHGGLLDDQGDCYAEKLRSGVAGTKDTIRTRAVRRGEGHWEEIVVAGDKIIITRWRDNGTVTQMRIVAEDDVVISATRVDAIVDPSDDVDVAMREQHYESDGDGTDRGTVTSHAYGTDGQPVGPASVRRRTGDDVWRNARTEGVIEIVTQDEEADSSDTSTDTTESGSDTTEQPNPDDGSSGGCDDLDRPTGNEGDEPTDPSGVSVDPGAMPADDNVVGAQHDDRLVIGVVDNSWVLETIDPLGNPNPVGG